MASLAGPQSEVASSSTNDARTNAHTRSISGIKSSTPARKMSQVINNRFRSTRSTITPPTDAKKNPGSTLANITKAMADPGWPPPSRLAISMIARNPIQSPKALTTWATQRRRNPGLPNTGCDRPIRFSSPLAAAAKDSFICKIAGYRCHFLACKTRRSPKNLGVGRSTW